MAVLKINDSKAWYMLSYLKHQVFEGPNNTIMAFFSSDIPTTANDAKRGITEFPSSYDPVWQTNETDFLWASKIVMPNNDIGEPLDIETNFDLAVNTGVVKWFGILRYFDRVNQGNPQIIDDTQEPFFWGSVGTSNADLIIPSTNILQGKNYRIAGIKLDIPRDI